MEKRVTQFLVFESSGTTDTMDFALSKSTTFFFNNSQTINTYNSISTSIYSKLTEFHS